MAHVRPLPEVPLESQTPGPNVASVHCTRVQPEYVAVVSARRKFVDTSDSFCKLLGYTREELLDRLLDDFTAPHTANIPIIWRLFVWTERMVGIWVFTHRSGTKLFVRYEAFARADGLYEAHMELLGAGA